MARAPVENVTDTAGTDASIDEVDHSGHRPVFGDTNTVLVRQRLGEDDADAVRESVERQRSTEPGTAWLVGGDDVATVSLFSETTDDAATELVWYVETVGDRWESPAGELERRSPLLDAGLTDTLAICDLAGRDATRQILHVQNPARPGTREDCDVVMVRMPIERRPGTWLVRALTGAYTRLAGTRLLRGFEQSAAGIVEAERMWTETLWLERTRSGYAVRWYMEADDMDRVMSAYEESDDRVARWSNSFASTVFGAPVTELGHPADAMDADGRELLAHATAPELR